MTIELAKDDEVTVQQDASCSFWAAIDTVEKDGADELEDDALGVAT